MPVLEAGRSALVLLPLVGPADCAVVLAALRAEFSPLPVARRVMSIDDLNELGPLSGRLDTPPAPEGTA
jgi:hypothetical protein